MTAEEGTKTTGSSRRSQIIANLIVNLQLLSLGLAFGWITISSVDLDSDKGSWIVTAVPIGACVGPILSALLLDHVGRKWFLYAMTFPLMASWILLYLRDKWLERFIARLIGGIAVGAIYSTVPIYLGELNEARIRGAASMMMALYLNMGFIIMYGLGTKLNDKLMALISLGPCVAYLLTAPWIPESPYYYLKKNNEKRAKLAMVWLRRKQDNEQELKEMQEFIKAEEQGHIKHLYAVPTHRKALLIVLLLLAGQQLSGYIGIQAYAVNLFHDMGINFQLNILLVMMGGISLVASLISTFLVDKIGRKPLFLISSYGSALSLLVIAAYFFMIKFGIKVQSYSALPLAAIVIYLICFSTGLASIPAVLLSELFPIGVKNWAAMIANVYGSVLSLIVTQTYHLIENALGNHIVFLLFAIIELVIAILASIFMPETARKSFASIQDILTKKNNKPNKAEAENNQ